jgi:hypothetical protein
MIDTSLSHPIWRKIFLNESYDPTFESVHCDPTFFSLYPIIIGGCGRSGTTLLASIFSSFPNIYVIPCETALLCPGCYGNFQYPLPINDIRLQSSISLDSFFSSCFDASYTSFNTWCEKTPRNIYYFKEIHEIFSGKVFF